MTNEYVLVNKEDLSTIAKTVRTATGSAQTYNVLELRNAVVETISNGSSTPFNNVLYVPQTLTEEERKQARINIDATSTKEVQPLFKAISIIQNVSGESISINDSSEYPLNSLKVFGKTTQDGTPTPEAPVELVSTNNPVVSVAGAEKPIQTLSLSTPNGLAGIPVSSGGNYTDENGQEWFCDMVDFEKKNITSYIVDRVLTGDEDWTMYGSTGNTYRYIYLVVAKTGITIPYAILCDKLPTIQITSSNLEYGIYITNSSQGNTRILLRMENMTTLAEYKAWLAENPLHVQYVITKPTITQLDTETLAAYNALHTNKPNTTIYSDNNAGLTAEYIADTKTYIDNKFAEYAQALLKL